MKKMCLIVLFVLIVASSAQAIPVFPVLQVGAPAGLGDSGSYADYIGSLNNPLEADTAITSGGVIYAAGAYKNDKVINLGGQDSSILSDWSDFGFNSLFDNYGAILMATVPDGTLGSGTLSVNSTGAIYSTAMFDETGFVVPNPPSNHDPIKDRDYMFFDIGNFDNNPDAVVNLATESGMADGEIKLLNIATSGFNWIHFDVFALETSVHQITGQLTASIISSFSVDLEGNPESKDVTWKQVPEPSTLILLGSSLLGLAICRKKFNA